MRGPRTTDSGSATLPACRLVEPHDERSVPNKQKPSVRELEALRPRLLSQRAGREAIDDLGLRIASIPAPDKTQKTSCASPIAWGT